MRLIKFWNDFSWSVLGSILWHPVIKWAGFIYPAIGQFIIFRISDDSVESSGISYVGLLDGNVSVEPILMYYGLLFLSFAVLLFSIFSPKVIKTYGDVDTFFFSGTALGDIAPEYIGSIKVEGTRKAMIKDYWETQENKNSKSKVSIKILVIVGGVLIITSGILRLISVSSAILTHYLT